MIQTVDTHNTENDTIEVNSSISGNSSQVTTQNKNSDMKPKTPVIVVILFVAVISGLGTGFGLHKLNAKSGSASEAADIASIKEQTPSSGIKAGEVYGSAKEDIFKDSAEGIIQAGGNESEGTHQLIRPGGPSQTVHLTSSVTDLDKFIGAKVKVWGETNTAQKAGWLMDVGRVKVEELNAELPAESKPTATPTPKGSTKKQSTSDDEGE